MGEPRRRDDDDDEGADANGTDGHGYGNGNGNGDAHDWRHHSGELGHGHIPDWWQEQWSTGEWRQTGAPSLGSPSSSSPTNHGQHFDGGGSVIAPPRTPATGTPAPLWPPDPPSPSRQQPPPQQPRIPGQRYPTPPTHRLQRVGAAGQAHYTPPSYYLGGPSAAYAQRRQEEEQRMYAATAAGRFGRWAGAPLDVTSQAMHSGRPHYINGKLQFQDAGIALYSDVMDGAEEHFLTAMYVHEVHSELTFSADLLREVIANDTDVLMPGQRESFWRNRIEPYPLRRFLLAWAWVRWYFWADIEAYTVAAHPAMVASPGAVNPGWHTLLATAWWPVRPPRANEMHRWPGSLQQPLWRREETSRYYGYMWRMVCDALTHRYRLEALTAVYLDSDVCPPWRSRDHQMAVYRMATDPRSGYGRDPRDAYAHYYRFLAQEAQVPYALIALQMEGDGDLNTPQKLLQLTEMLCNEYQDLDVLRTHMARKWTLPCGELALRLFEPIALLTPPRIRRTGGPR